MSALSGQVVLTLRDGTGAVYIQATISWAPATGVLRDAVVATSRGNQTGALVVDNQTGSAQSVVVADSAGTVSRTVAVPANGFTATAAALAGQGVTTISDLNGFTFDLA